VFLETLFWWFCSLLLLFPSHFSSSSLYSLSEVKREAILAERFQKRKEMTDRKALKKQLQTKEKTKTIEDSPKRIQTLEKKQTWLNFCFFFFFLFLQDADKRVLLLPKHLLR
jgi:hypothetical protein